MMANILVVDNDEQYPAMLAKMLRKNNHIVAIANDGEGALHFCKMEKFDLIITDIFMPVMDGLELIMNLTELSLKIPVIAISGGSRVYSCNTALSHAITFGATVSLAKPFTELQLLDAVNVALNQF